MWVYFGSIKKAVELTCVSLNLHSSHDAKMTLVRS